MPTDRIRVSEAEDAWFFKLYVNDKTKNSLEAIRNLEAICDKYFKDRCNIDIIDIEKYPEIASVDQVVAIPTLKITVPLLLTKLVGDLSNIEKVFVELDLPLKK